LDEDLKLCEIEYGYVKIDRRNATPTELDQLVDEIARQGWQIRWRPVDPVDIAEARAALLSDLT
jgi:hypothetical protein